MIVLSILISFTVSLVTVIVSFFFCRRKLRRELETGMILQKLKLEIGEMLTALNGTTERNIALLENQVRIINDLIKKASKTAGVLKREQEKQKNIEQVYSSLGRLKPLTLEVEEAQKEETLSSVNAPGVSETSGIDFESLSIRERALVLHRNGEKLEAIATRLDMSLGEIELIISLHERRS